MTDEIWVMKKSTALRLEAELPKIEREAHNPFQHISHLMFMPKIVAVPDHYLIRDIVANGYSKAEIMSKFYPYRSKKKRIRKKWFKRYGRKYL